MFNSTYNAVKYDMGQTFPIVFSGTDNPVWTDKLNYILNLLRIVIIEFQKLSNFQ